MRCFFAGLGGALVMLVAVALIFPFYSDYGAAAKSSEWLMHIQPLQRQIEDIAVKQNELRGIKEKIAKPDIGDPALDVYEVLDTGAIILRGGREGQLLVLLPSLEKGKVFWRCVGGSRSSVLPSCRN